MPPPTPPSTPTLPSFRRWLDGRCAAAPDRTFLEFRNRRWSYADLARITDTVAAALHARGVAPGDRVAITLPNSPEHLFAWLGAAKLGATVAPLHAQWTRAELDRALAQLRPKLVLGELPDSDPASSIETETKTEAKTFIEGKNEKKSEDDNGEAEAKTSIEGKDESKDQDGGEGAGPGASVEERGRVTGPIAPSAAPPHAPLSSSSPLPSSFPSMKASASVSLSSSFPSMEAFAVASPPRLGRDELSRLIEGGSEAFPEVSGTPASAPAELLFTSGTTGMPKAAVQSFRSMMLTGEAFADWLGLGPDDRLFTCLPLAHVNARFYSTMGALAAGAGLVLEEKFSASGFWRWMAESGATVVNTIGAMLRILLQAPPSELEHAHRLRIVYTSPALGEELHRELEERFGVRLVVGYGMTECTFGFIHPIDLPLSSPDRHLGSMGRPRRHPDPRWPTGWRLVDPSTAESAGESAGEPGTPREVEPGETGEIWLSAPTLFSGYFENEAATASVLSADGWLRTGDLATRDAGGFWSFVGRTKEMIRRRGENVSPLEIEELLMSHPAVAEAAVLGVPSALGEEEIAAFVVVKPEGRVDAEALRDFCVSRLARFKVPSEWRFLERLPRTSTNRVAKKQLAALRGDSPSG